MGNTCASFHVFFHGPRDIALPKAIQAVSRAYSSIGYERTSKPVTNGKHVVLHSPVGQHFLSVFDSNNAQLDNGELKDAALKTTKSLRSTAVFTSLYDSDWYEFILFNDGRQVDCLMQLEESGASVMKQMKPKDRPKHWSF